MNLLHIKFEDGSVDDYYADEERLCQSGAQTQKVGDVTYLFGNDGTRVKEAGFQTVVDEKGVTHTYYLNADSTVSLGNHTAYQQEDRTVSWLTVGSTWYSGRCRNWRTPFRLAKGRYSNLLYETRFL